MKKAKSIAFAAVLLAGAAFALDTTVSNDFWCTWNYPNRDSAVAQASASASSPLDSLVSTTLPSDPIAVFSSYSAGALIIIR